MTLSRLETARRALRARRPQYYAQAGMSLMEILLVIAIVAFLIIGGLTLFVQAQNQGQAQRAQQQLGNLASSIRSLYAGQSTYTGIDIPTLYRLAAVPEDMQDGGNNQAVFNSFGGAVAISDGNGCGGGAGDFCITFPGLTQESCQQLASARVGFVAVGTGGNADNQAPVQVTDPAMGQLCPAGATSDLTFMFSG